MSHPKTKIALALMALFVTGAVAGVAIGRRFPSALEMRQMPPTERAAFVLEQTTTKLDLSAQQAGQLLPIFESAVVKARMLTASQQRQRMALIRDIDAEVTPLLTAEQRVVLEKLRAGHRGKVNPIKAPSATQP